MEESYDEAAEAVALLENDDADGTFEPYGFDDAVTDEKITEEEEITEEDGDSARVIPLATDTGGTSGEESVEDARGKYKSWPARFFVAVADKIWLEPVKNVFYSVADWFEARNDSDSKYEEWNAVAEDAASDAYMDVAFMEPAGFTADLHNAAEDIRNGGAGGETVTGDLYDAMAGCAGISPSDTADVLQMFNETALADIAAAYDSGSDEYAAAESDLATVMTVMTEPVYAKTLEMEQSGTRMLSEDERTVMNDLSSLTGVAVGYDGYVPGTDISLPADDSAYEAHAAMVTDGYLSRNGFQKQDDPERMRFSSGSDYAGIDVSSAVRQADDLVVSGYMETASRNDGQRSGTMSYNMESRIAAVRDGMQSSGDGMEEAGRDGYMGLMMELQAFNDEAALKITDKYESGSSEYQAAVNGLGTFMRNNVEEVWNAMKADDDALGLFNAGDLDVFDNACFTGVNVSYGDYSEGIDLKTGGLKDTEAQLAYEKDLEAQLADPDYYTEEERMLYGSSGVSSDIYGGTGRRLTPFADDGTRKERSREAVQDGPKRLDRGKAAEEAFGETLERIDEYEAGKDFDFGE